MSPVLPPLVSPDALAAVLDRPDVLVVDASTTLEVIGEGRSYRPVPGLEGFREAHLPGAVFADVAGPFSDPDGAFPFAFPSPERFAAAAGAIGIGPDTHVVAYDTAGNAWATRLWWLLRAFGHDAVSVLDGGRGAWTAAGHPVESGDPAPRPATFTPRPRPELVASTEEVRRLSDGGGSATVVNALDEATFRGESDTTPYARRGRIPGSVNLPLFTLLDPDTGRFLPEEQLAAKLRDAGILDAQRAVTYCGGGIAATLPAFAAHLLGAEVAVYDGSLSEWTADPDLPVQTG